jgi:hypothetical protein
VFASNPAEDPTNHVGLILDHLEAGGSAAILAPDIVVAVGRS